MNKTEIAKTTIKATVQLVKLKRQQKLLADAWAQQKLWTVPVILADLVAVGACAAFYLAALKAQKEPEAAILAGAILLAAASTAITALLIG